MCVCERECEPTAAFQCMCVCGHSFVPVRHQFGVLIYMYRSVQLPPSLDGMEASTSPACLLHECNAQRSPGSSTEPPQAQVSLQLWRFLPAPDHDGRHTFIRTTHRLAMKPCLTCIASINGTHTFTLSYPPSDQCTSQLPSGALSQAFTPGTPHTDLMMRMASHRRRQKQHTPTERRQAAAICRDADSNQKSTPTPHPRQQPFIHLSHA
mmetsp:Transcript_11739/g.28200  ORF Transcript_11739/g.28200 Transcript_11739/m.28200 type:complete len:209 (+) Transcript_11739:1274-1900(+)